MQVNFESRDPEAVQLREVAVSRLRFVTRRFSAMVPRATVQLTDINGPRGGVDKRCHVELTTDSSTKVMVTAVSSNWRSAIDQAVTRAARTLARTWRREHSTEHAQEHQIKRGWGQRAAQADSDHPAAKPS